MAHSHGSYFVIPASPSLDNTGRASSSSCCTTSFTRRKPQLSISATKQSHADHASSHGLPVETEGPKEEGGGAITDAVDVSSAVSSLNRRALLGISTASAVALGGNLAGVTSFLLGLNSSLSRSLKLDVIYPINGYKRCLEKSFEFLYPNTWVGDQRLLYQAAERAEKQRLYGEEGIKRLVAPNIVEPAVAFGPPGSSGELNVSVIVAPVSQDFRLDKLGDPTVAGDLILKSFVRKSKVTPTLLTAEKTEDSSDGSNVLYYKLEFSVKGESFLRHNVAVYAANKGQLFSLNAQTPERLWPEFKEQFFVMSNSFKVRFP